MLTSRQLAPVRKPADTAAAPTDHHIPPLLPLGAMLLAGSLASTGWAQATSEDTAVPTAQTTPADGAARTLGTVTVHDSALDGATNSKVQLRATRTRIGKGEQALRDIPQSVTVITEKMIQDRNMDDFREVLRNTAGVTFQTGETGEEDVRLRGFSLGQAGDIYRDGMRDGALYERDTFNDDRVEIIKGSASMLFGKGSTGGVVNQVSKQPFLMDQHEASVTLGNGGKKRVQGDLNLTTGDHAAVRLNLMAEDSSNWGARQRKWGIAPTYRWGVGQRDEFSVGFFHLDNKGRSTYNSPWLINADGGIVPTLPAKNYYGLDSDKLNTRATYATVTHTHRFDGGGELRTRLRHGRYERDLWASVIRFAPPGPTVLDDITDATVLTRSPKGRVGTSDVTLLQSDYSNTFDWGGREHAVLAGVDITRESAKRDNNFPGTASGLDTTVGTPNNGDWRPDDRGTPSYNTFKASNIGIYAQDTLAVTDTLKLVAGVRVDHFKGRYHAHDQTSRGGVFTPAYDFNRSDTLLSPRVGMIWQPSETAAYYVSYGTSYNTSADTYQFTPNVGDETLANTPAEKSRNIEIGGKWELLNQRLSFAAAAFYSEKYNERNQDPDSAAEQFLLSGKRHAAGLELNAAGHLAPKWELFWNHTWIPIAKIDHSNLALRPDGGGAQVQGDRPGLTPRHSGSLWTTYRLMPKLRLGLGANYRSGQQPDGQRGYTTAGFITFDAMAEYSLTPTTLLKFNVTNLTDKLYADSLYRGFYAPGQPRRLELSLKTLF